MFTSGIMSLLIVIDALRIGFCSPHLSFGVQTDICSSPILAVPSNGPIISEPFFYGLCMVILGGLFRLWAQNSLGRFFTFEVTIKPDHKLITTGPYSLVRHPSYLGFIIMKAGLSIMQFSEGSILQD